MIWIPIGVSIILGIWCIVLIFRIRRLVLLLRSCERMVDFYRRCNERLNNELQLHIFPHKEAKESRTDYDAYYEAKKEGIGEHKGQNTFENNDSDCNSGNFVVDSRFFTRN